MGKNPAKSEYSTVPNLAVLHPLTSWSPVAWMLVPRYAEKALVVVTRWPERTQQRSKATSDMKHEILAGLMRSENSGLL